MSITELYFYAFAMFIHPRSYTRKMVGWVTTRAEKTWSFLVYLKKTSEQNIKGCCRICLYLVIKLNHYNIKFYEN